MLKTRRELGVFPLAALAALLATSCTTSKPVVAAPARASAGVSPVAPAPPPALPRPQPNSAPNSSPSRVASKAELPQWTRGRPAGSPPLDAALLKALNEARRSRNTYAPQFDGQWAVPESGVLLVGKVWDKTVVLLPHANERHETAAEVWTSTSGAPFVQVHDFHGYDFGCMQGDDVCERARPVGIGLLGILEQHPSGRLALFVRVPAGRTASLRTVEGRSLELKQAASAHGQVVEIRTRQPWRINVRVATAAAGTYQLPMPVGGVIWVS